MNVAGTYNKLLMCNTVNFIVYIDCTINFENLDCCLVRVSRKLNVSVVAIKDKFALWSLLFWLLQLIKPLRHQMIFMLILNTVYLSAIRLGIVYYTNHKT